MNIHIKLEAPHRVKYFTYKNKFIRIKKKTEVIFVFSWVYAFFFLFLSR